MYQCPAGDADEECLAHDYLATGGDLSLRGLGRHPLPRLEDLRDAMRQKEQPLVANDKPLHGEPDERIAKVLAVLDAMEAEGYIEPYVAAAVRKEVGLPPRHWPPQPGDVWTERNPFSPLWFAQLSHHDGHTDFVMVPMDGGPQGLRTRTPDEVLEESASLTLAYRRPDGDR
jgi:hypothetical protein